MISKHSPLPQFLDEEVALIVNDDSSPRADTKRVAHSVSVILLKDGLGLPKGSSRLRGLFQASRWGSSGSCWKEKNGRVAGRAQSRRPLKWQRGALRARSRNLEKNGPWQRRLQGWGQVPKSLRPRGDSQATSSNPRPPLGDSHSHARWAAKAGHGGVPAGRCEARTHHLQSPPQSRCAEPRVGQPGLPTHLASAGGKRQTPETAITSSARACVTARSMLATSGHPDDVGAWS